MNVLTQFWDWVDNRKVIRRIVLFVTLALTWRSFEWASHFAETTNHTGVEVAAMIAAVTGPVSTLMGFVARFYHLSRDSEVTTP